MISRGAVIVSGVSGSGKSTVGELLAERLDWRFVDADDLHPASNREKMSAGIALDDRDRWPWLDIVGKAAHAGEATGIVIACSALRRSYRDLIAQSCTNPFFVQLWGTPELFRERIEQRTGHFMPAALLASQLDTLEELGADEPGAVVPVDVPPEQIISGLVALLESR